MKSSVRGGWVGECSLLSGVQQSDGLREEAVSRSAGSGPECSGQQEPLMIFRAFLTHRWVWEKIIGGREAHLRRCAGLSELFYAGLSGWERCSSRTRRWCSQSGCSPQCNWRTVWGFLSSNFFSRLRKKTLVGMLVLFMLKQHFI